MSKIEELSKEISYALRHAPWEYELDIDEEGWVSVIQLLEALHRIEKWKNISEADLEKLVEESEKKRHEIVNGRIRAFYGHSIPRKILKEEKRPPDLLYHGTAMRFLESINEKGLLAKDRQYVHLSQDVNTAENVGKRHGGKVCILVIDAKGAWNNGIRFYIGNDNVWLSDMIPPKYIRGIYKED